MLKKCFIVSSVYFWTDEQGRKLKCSAPLYFDYAMSYVQDLLTDEDVFPTKAGEKPPPPPLPQELSTLQLSSLSLVFRRFGLSDRLHLPRAEGVSAVFADSRSYLLVSLQRGAGAGPAPPPQHTLHTPHALLQPARPAGAGGPRASAGPNRSAGTIEHGHNVPLLYISITTLHVIIQI